MDGWRRPRGRICGGSAGRTRPCLSPAPLLWATLLILMPLIACHGAVAVADVHKDVHRPAGAVADVHSGHHRDDGKRHHPPGPADPPASAHARTATSTAHSPRPRTLLWIPVHVSEPTSNLEAMAACMFTRHKPSLTGETFDILITLAGNVSDGREADLARVVRQATAHITPSRPTVRVEHIHVDKDSYDKDHSKARRSSYAGPNTVFYSVMVGGGGGEGADEGAPRRDGLPPPDDEDTVTDGTSSVFVPGRRSVADAFMPTAPNATALHTRHIAPYTFVQLLETDCCAVAGGWLDVLLAPMLAKPDIVMSGSRTRASCYSSSDASGCKTRVAAHLRLHINGNAMYRVGPALRSVIREAWDEMLDVAPFDLAMYFVRKDNQSHVHDNRRMYSVGAPVDAEHWDDAAYYGVDEGVVWVHAPRRLRQDGVASVVHRADTEFPAVAVVVAPGGGGDGPGRADSAPGSPSPSPSSSVAVPLLHNCHKSLVATQSGLNLVYVALTWPAFVEASRVAPFHVVLANGTGGRGGAESEVWVDPATLAARALSTLAALSRAGLHTLVIGSDAAMVRPDVLVDLAVLERAREATGGVADRAGRPTLRLLQSPGGAAPLATHLPAPSTARPVLNVGMMQVPAGDAAAAFLEHWAEQRAKEGNTAGSSAWSRASTLVAAPSTCKVRRWTDCGWRGENLTVDWLPAEAYAAGASYWGPLWTAAARKQAAFVVAAGLGGGAGTAPPEFRLRQAGLWHGSPAPACANYSAVARLPVPLGRDVVSVHRALARHAAFLEQVARRRIACAILPGFRLASTGNVVPYDAVLRADVVGALARRGDGGGGGGGGGGPRFFPSAAALDAPYDSFVDVVGVAGGRRRQRRRRRTGSVAGHSAAAPAASASGKAAAPASKAAAPPHRSLLAVAAAGSRPPSPARQSTSNTTTAGACAVFGMHHTSCYAPDVAAAIVTAAAGLPPRFWCVADPGRSPAEAAVLALEGRLHKVDAVVRQVVGDGSDASPILLTGPAWRATAAARTAGDTAAHILTLADLPGLPSSDPVAALVRPDTPAPPTSAGGSPFADIIEYALCQSSAGVRFLPATGVPGLLLPHNTPPSTLLPRLAARIPPSLLHEDLDALDAWLARPDRPGLGGRWVRTRWARQANGTSPQELSPAQGADMVTATVRDIHALGAPLGCVPGLPQASPCTTTVHCQPTAWSTAFGSAVLREMYGSTHSQLLPPAAAVLMLPDAAALDVFRGDGLPLVVGGPGFPASAGQVADEVRHARTAAVVRRVLDGRAGGSGLPGSRRPHRFPPPPMWMDGALEADRLARLRYFVDEGGVVVLDHVM